MKLNDMLRSSGDQSSAFNKTSYNFGTIMNYQKMDGLNDRTNKDAFRKWTGMP